MAIFISYSRQDAAFARRLTRRLNSIGFALWRDRSHMLGGEDWWRQIKAAIEGSETLVLCMSPSALASPVVQDEWLYARRIGKRVIPVVARDVDFKTLPRWMNRVDWVDFRPSGAVSRLLRSDTKESQLAWERFINQLKTPYPPYRATFAINDLPDDFVARPAEFEPLVSGLLNPQESATAITALRGAGGYGKTTLALALCHDERVQLAFDDGIFWVTLGDNLSTGDVEARIRDLLPRLKKDYIPFSTLEGAHHSLRDAVGNRYILLVVDDVWHSRDLQPFLEAGKHAVTLVTTRNAGTLGGRGVQHHLDAMTPVEAVQLLGAGLYPRALDDDHKPTGEWAIPAEDRSTLLKLAQRLGEWPLLLKLANRQLRNRVGLGEDVPDALNHISLQLDQQGFMSLTNPDDPNERHRATDACLEISLRLLEPADMSLFNRLAIFLEDTAIPLTTLTRWWGLQSHQTEALCEKLYKLSLLLHYSLTTRSIRLHDVIREHLNRVQYERITEWQHAFLEQLGDLHDLPDDYTWRHIAYHLKEARQLPKLRELLLNPGWLQAKLEATDVSTLVADYDYLIDDTSVQLIKSALGMSVHVLNHDKSALAGQLAGRLMSHRATNPEIKTFTDRLEPPTKTFFPISLEAQPTHQQAGGALLRTLEGHTAKVNSVALAGDFAISASSDKTLRVWNWVTGEHLRTLKGHRDDVNSVALAGDFAISASDDKTLGVWNWVTGEHLRTLEGHTAKVNSVSIAGDFAVSASADTTLRVWDWRTGEHLRTLKGHRDDVNSVALAGDFAISAAGGSLGYDNTLRVWNWHTGEHLRTLDGHTEGVNSVSVASEFAISASWDNTLRVWNWVTGQYLRTLEEYPGWVNSVVMAGNFAIFVSDDRTLRIWNWVTGEYLRTLEGHTDSVNSVALADDFAISASDDKTLCVWHWSASNSHQTANWHTNVVKSVALAGDFAISASDDKTLRVWNRITDKHLRILEGHTSDVNSVVMAGNFAISASGSGHPFGGDNTLHIWDWFTGKLLRTLEGHTSTVTSVALAAGDFAISACLDSTLRVWNWQTGEHVRTLEGHTNRVNSVALAENFAISASHDHTLCVWNWITGEHIRTLKGHVYSVFSVAVAGDFAISASWDTTLRVWNWVTGERLRTLEGHTDIVWSVALAGNFAISASSDRTLRVWNWQTGQQVGIFYGDAPLRSVAALPEGDGLSIVAGDEVGRVLFLRFHLPQGTGTERAF